MTVSGAAIRGSASGRDPLERWYTPDDVAADHVAWARHHAVLLGAIIHHMHDPCGGGGAYLRAMRAYGSASASDIAPGAPGIDKVGQLTFFGGA